MDSIDKATFDGDRDALTKAQRLVKQLRGAKSRGHTSMLDVSGELTKPTRGKLTQLLEDESVSPDHLVSLSEAEIKAEASAMRKSMGLPEPYEKSDKSE